MSINWIFFFKEHNIKCINKVFNSFQKYLYTKTAKIQLTLILDKKCKLPVVTTAFLMALKLGQNYKPGMTHVNG